MQGLFGQVLRLCHEAGMVRLGVIAIDGTKIAANASWAKSYTADALAHQVAEEQAAFDTAVAAGDHPRGPRPKDEVAYGPPRRRGKDGTITEDQIIVGFRASQNPTDHHELPDVLDATIDALRDAGIAPKQQPTKQQPTEQQPTEEELIEASGRVDELGVVVAAAGYANEETFAQAEAAGVHLIAPLASDEKLQSGDDPAAGQDLTERPATARAQAKLRTQTGRDLYKIRERTAEPVFGQLKDRRDMRQFATRGLPSVTTEFSLACTVHNLLKLFTGRRTAPNPA